jgi:hypothetical protein
MKVRERLMAEEFKVELEEHDGDYTFLSFEKEKNEPVAGFRNNAFCGSLSLQNTIPTRFSVHASLLMDDLILVETGEREDLRNYLDMFLGLESAPPVKNLTFTLLMGLCLATVTVLFSSLTPESVISIPSLYLTEGLASLGYLLFGTFHIFNAKGDAYCVGLSILGIFLSILMIIVGLGFNYSSFGF